RALGDRLAAGGRRDVNNLGLGRRLGRRRLRGRGGRRAGPGPVAAGGDLREQGADLDGLALGGVDLDQDARGGGGDLGVDLVGGDLDEDVVDLDGVALLLV